MITLIQGICDCLIAFSISTYTCESSSIYLLVSLFLQSSKMFLKTPKLTCYLFLILTSLVLFVSKLIISLTGFQSEITVWMIKSSESWHSVLPDLLVLVFSLIGLMSTHVSLPFKSFSYLDLITLSGMMIYSGLVSSTIGFLLLLTALAMIVSKRVFRNQDISFIHSFGLCLSYLEILSPFLQFLLVQSDRIDVFEDAGYEDLIRLLLILIQVSCGISMNQKQIDFPEGLEKLINNEEKELSFFEKVRILVLYIMTTSLLWGWIMKFKGLERLVYMFWIFYSIMEKNNTKIYQVSRFLLIPTLALAQSVYYLFALAQFDSLKNLENFCFMTVTQSCVSIWTYYSSSMTAESDVWSSIHGSFLTWIVKKFYIISLIVLFLVGLSDINVLYTGLMAFCIWFMLDPAALKKYWKMLLLYEMFILMIRGLWIFLLPLMSNFEDISKIVGLPTNYDLTIYDYLLWLLLLTTSIQQVASQVELEQNEEISKFIALVDSIYNLISQFEVWVMYFLLLIIQTLGVVNYLNSVRFGLTLVVIFKHLSNVNKKIILNYLGVYHLLVVLEVYSGVLLAIRYVYQFLKFIPSADHLEFPNIGFQIYEVKELYESTAADCVLLIVSVFASRNCKRLSEYCDVSGKKIKYKIFKKYFSNPFVYVVLIFAFFHASLGLVSLVMMVNVVAISSYQISTAWYFNDYSKGLIERKKLTEWRKRAVLWKVLFVSTSFSLFLSYFAFLVNGSYLDPWLLNSLEFLLKNLGFSKDFSSVLAGSKLNLVFLLLLVVERHCLQYNIPSTHQKPEKVANKEAFKKFINFIRVLNLFKSIFEALIPAFFLMIAFYRLDFIAFLYVSLIFISLCTSDLIHPKFLFVSANMLTVAEYFFVCCKYFLAYVQVYYVREFGLLSEWLGSYLGLFQLGTTESQLVLYELLTELFMLIYFFNLSYREKQLLEIEEKYKQFSSNLQDTFDEDRKSSSWKASLKNLLIHTKKGFYLISRYLLVGVALLFITQSIGLLSTLYYIFLLIFILKEISIYLSKNIMSYLKLVTFFLRFLILDLTLQIFIQIPLSLFTDPVLEKWCKCVGLVKLTGNSSEVSSNLTAILFKVYTFLVVLMLQRMMKSKDYEEFLSKFFREFEEKSKKISEEMTEHFNNERIKMNKFYAESNQRFEGELKKIEANIQTWKKNFQTHFKRKLNRIDRTFTNISMKTEENCEENQRKSAGLKSKLNSFLVSFVDPYLFKNFIKKITVMNYLFDSAPRKNARLSVVRGMSRRNTDKNLDPVSMVSFQRKSRQLNVLHEKTENSEDDSDSSSSDSSSSSSDSGSNLSVHSVNEIKFQDSIEKEDIEYELKFKDYFLVFIYSLASNTESIVYLTFFLNNWMYCSLESLVFPLSALSYGMLLYPRPPSKYFRLMLFYTEFVFFIKLMVQLEVWTIVFGYDFLKDFQDPFKLGFNLAKNTYSQSLFRYILWDVIVIVALLLHNFYLIKVGFWFSTETEIESLNEAKERLGLKSRQTFKKEVKKQTLIENLLPTSKEEKPGRDFYFIAITAQMVILVYIFCFFTQMDGNSQNLSQAIRANQFQGRMIVVLLIQMSLIIVERYFYVSRTSQALTEAQKTKESMANTTPVARYRSSTAYGSEISSRLPRGTASGPPFNFKETLVQNEKSKSNMRLPPLLRIVVFLFLLFAVHLIVFFYLPFNGNYSSNGSIFCRNKTAHCNDFESNRYLQGFYLLYLVYLIITAMQIKYSLPSFSKVTFPLMRDSGARNYYLFLAYRSAPFLFEIRTLMDWTFSSTALTIFQWFKFEDIYAQLFINECYQKSMNFKPHGNQIANKQKFFMGVCGLFIILVIIFIPLLVFSSINPITENNPVYSASLNLNLALKDRRFELYSIHSAEKIEEVRQDDWENLYKFNEIHQLSSSDQPHMQKVTMPVDSDQVWAITPPNKKKLCQMIRETSDQTAEASLLMRYSFFRRFPVTKTEVTLTVNKLIESSTLGDVENLVCLGKNNSILVPKVFDDLIRLPSSGDEIFPIVIQAERAASDLLLSLEQEDGAKWWKICTLDDFGRTEGVSFFTVSDSYSFVTLNFSILTFYISVVYVVGTLIKYVTKGSGRNVVMTDMKNTKDLQVLCEGIYISRMIGKLKEEEELYFELLDILRSPEITKMITGSSSIKQEDSDKKNR